MYILIICQQTVKWLQVLLFNTNFSIQHYSVVRIQLNISKYCYISLTIQLSISYLFTQLTDLAVLFVVIQFGINHLFVHSLNVKQIYYTTTPGQSGSGSNGNEGVLNIIQISRAEASPSNFLCHIQDTHRGVLLLCRDAIGIFYNLSRLGSWNIDKELNDITI